ncbi:MAG: CDC27 family protein [Bacteroidales bacterium]
MFHVYWNGREALHEGVQLLADQEVDNYYEILPVYQFGSITDTQITVEKMNRAIEKATTAVKKHSILIRGVEYVKFIDDAYLLLGKAFFYKHQFSKARMVFNYVVSEFPKNPEKNEARLWVARTYIQEKEYDMAIALITKVQAEKNLSSSLRRELALTFADFYLAQKQYEQAIPYLEKGKQLTKNKDFKSRINFILGQIEQLKGNTHEAYLLFKDCLKANPPLVMSFNARLNIALCYDNKTMNSADISKELLRMLKDSKNERNFGRIYFVLAEIAFKDQK